MTKLTRLIDLTGQRFGRLVVLRRAPNAARNDSRVIVRWECVCDCGTARCVFATALRSGATRSCGCLHAEVVVSLHVTHGESNGNGKRGTLEYRTWAGIKKRCLNKSDPNYKFYGLLGVGICARWRSSFEAFLSDMGRCPAGLSIDRVETAGSYDCGACADCVSRGVTRLNCRWATRREQALNKRNNRLLTYMDETKTLDEWAVSFGINSATLADRIDKQGLPIGEALTRPVRG